MNDLGIALLWAAFQATALTLAGAVCYLVTVHRGPAAASRVAAGFLAALIVVPVFALCPLPSWWSWTTLTTASTPQIDKAVPDASALRSKSETPVEVAGPTASETEDGAGLSLPLGLFRNAWLGLKHASRPTANPRWNWPAVLALVMSAGAALGLARLLLGVWALHRWCRLGRRVDDAALHRLLDELRGEMAGPSPIEVREVADLPAPATVGWFRPVILLPSDWRTWDDAERRAVLAHERADVCHRDYLAVLAARLGIALHFYHPLVYWLAGRLHLQQELAADALGAHYAGGHGPYLRALARMALRQEGRPLGWPARAFLSGTGTLKRRIQMLRSRHGFPERPAPRRRRVLALALLAVMVLGITALRSPAQKNATEGPNAAAVAPSKTAGEASPFDLTYLAPDAVGVMAVRPAAILGRPELRPALDLINLWYALGSKASGLPAGLDLRLEAIEQVVCTPRIETRKNAKGPASPLLIGLSMVRTVEDFDWKKQIKKLAPKLVEISYAGKTYLKIPQSPRLLMFDNPLTDLCCYVPDGRTLVIDSEPNLRRLLDAQRPAPQRVWAEDWKHFERDVVAFAFDLQDKCWTADRRQPEVGSMEELLLLKSATSVVCGVDLSNSCECEARLRCVTAESGEKATQAVKDIVAEGRKSQEAETKEGKPEGFQLIVSRFTQDLLRNSKVIHEGNLIRWRAEARVNLEDVTREFLRTTETLKSFENDLKEKAPR